MAERASRHSGVGYPRSGPMTSCIGMDWTWMKVETGWSSARRRVPFGLAKTAVIPGRRCRRTFLLSTPFASRRSGLAPISKVSQIHSFSRPRDVDEERRIRGTLIEFCVPLHEKLDSVMLLSFDGDRLAAIRVVRNPHKSRWLATHA